MSRHHDRLAFSWRLLASLWLLTAAARGQTSGWLSFDGQIKGESVQTNHIDWIEIAGFDIGGKLNAADVGRLGFTKRLDRASPPLTLACSRGTRFPKVTLDLNHPAPNTGQPAPARIELEDVFVSSIEIRSGGERPMESFSLAFGRIVYTYYTGSFSSRVSNYDFRFRTGENSAGTNIDTDSDGLPDAWETAYGFPIGTNNSAEDPDGDGFTNLQEYQLGTDPRSGTSFFRAELTPVSGSPGDYQLRWNSVVGKIYIIEWTPDLKAPFTTLRTFTAVAAASTADIRNTGRIGFYRVRPQ